MLGVLCVVTVLNFFGSAGDFDTRRTNQTRALAVAIYLLIAGIIGLGFGPVFVGTLSDMFAAGNVEAEGAALQKALMFLAMFNLWAGLHYWFAQRDILKRIAN